MVWMQMILRHRLMLRDQDIMFQENLDPLVREKLLHALASVACVAEIIPRSPGMMNYLLKCKLPALTLMLPYLSSSNIPVHPAFQFFCFKF